MKRKMYELEDQNNFRWFVLQDATNGKEAQLRGEREKVWVKEGVCEECGVFDVLSRADDKFLCEACLEWINSNKKNNKRK